MRLIDADKLTEEWLDAENEPVYCANDVLSSIDEQPTKEECVAYQQMIKKKSKKIGVNVFNMINNNTTDFMKTHNETIGDLINDLLRDMECELENIRDMVHDNTISNEDVIDYIDDVIDIIR